MFQLLHNIKLTLNTLLQWKYIAYLKLYNFTIENMAV